MKTKILVALTIILPLIFALFLMLRYVNLPYAGPNATDANKLSLISRNYNYWGFLNTKFTPIIDVSVSIAKHPTLYFNHGVLMQVFSLRSLDMIFGSGGFLIYSARFFVSPYFF